MALENVQKALHTLESRGSNPTEETYFVTCDSSRGRSRFRRGVLPCLTCRAEGPWVTNRGRRLKLEEMMRLQGMDPSEFTVAVTNAKLGAQLGNAMSVNVVERILVRALPAAGLVTHGLLVDRWETGKQPNRFQARSVMASRKGRIRRPHAHLYCGIYLQNHHRRHAQPQPGN